MEKRVLICEDSLEGIFSAIYDAYAEKCVHDFTRIQTRESENLELFTSYEHMVSCNEKAVKVIRMILNQFGEETYLYFCRALATEDAEKANAVYHVLQKGISEQNRRIMEKFSEECVNKVFELSRYTNNEIMHLRGFLRFQELENGVLFARIGPRNNILTFLAPHFADRLPGENFIIYDDTRGICVIHPVGREWFLMDDRDMNESALEHFSEKELEYRELFTFFCEKIGIEERRNPGLQRQMCALHFQKYMSEFTGNVPPIYDKSKQIKTN
ncbi:MAG: TIGR03915 family putative DNA repair protein [Lachnospiraceae bacterium]|nr:TIGR03915 family putative DNA repair protein [Lachnospiraceae bacterium]